MAAHASHGKKLDEVVAALTDLEMLAVKSDQRDVRTQQILAGLVDGLSRPFLIPGPATTNDGAAATCCRHFQQFLCAAILSYRQPAVLQRCRSPD